MITMGKSLLLLCLFQISLASLIFFCQKDQCKEKYHYLVNLTASMTLNDESGAFFHMFHFLWLALLSIRHGIIYVTENGSEPTFGWSDTP